MLQEQISSEVKENTLPVEKGSPVVISVKQKQLKLRLRILFATALKNLSNLIDRFRNEVEADGWRAAFYSVTELATFYARSRLTTTIRRSLSYPLNWVRPPSPIARRDGVLFIGYVEAALGLAESLRGLISAASDRQIDFGIYPFRVGVETRIIGQFMPEKYDLTHSYEINVIEVAADQVPTVFRMVDPRKIESSYNILRTYWELSKAPQEWSLKLAGVDEIWAPNEFVRDAFKEIFSGPITIIPPCVDIQELHAAEREVFGMKGDRFYFIFSFDYYSFPQRKNPLGVLDAFRRAFPDLNENVGLIIKSTGSKKHHPKIKEQIRLAAETDPRISVFDHTMSRKMILGLIRASDCYVSLHRAEGFGLGMVEAMSLGKVVIATDYSGSRDFLSAETGFPVAFNLRAVGPDEYVWTEGQIWAEPDMNSAIAAFRSAFGDVEARSRKAAAGKALVNRKYGKAAVGAAIERRIKEISQERAAIRD